MPSFLSPLFLLGALAAAIPVVLHLLKREPEPRVKFAAVKLLKDAPVANTEKRRIHELLLLALRVSTLVLLAVAFARPFLVSATAITSSGATIVALDTSYSMSAPGVFERATQLARDAINRGRAGDLTGVVTFSDAPEVAAALGSDRALALAAIDAAARGFGATRYRAALSAAVQTLGGRPGTIVVVTDLQESGWDAGDRASVPETVRIEVLDAGAARTNLAVTSIRAAGDRVIATIRNAGDAVRETRARLSLNDSPAGESPVALGPHATAEVEFTGASRASTAAVAIDDRDGIAADDVRYAVLDGASGAGVLVVTSNGDLGRDAFYVQQALSAGSSRGRAYRAAAVAPARLSTIQLPELSANAAIVILSTSGLERRGREALGGYVQEGGGLLIAAGPDVDGEVVSDVLGGQAPLRIATAADATPVERSLIPIDARHPVLRAFGPGVATLGLVKFRRVAQLQGKGCQTIARFTSGEAALLTCDAGEGRALVLGSDLNNRWNDFPLRATFVPFVHEALNYVSNHGAQGSQWLVADVPAGVPPTPGFATVRETAQTGESRRVAVNVDPRESDLARLSEDEFQATVTRLKDVGTSEAKLEARQLEDRQQLWMYALGLAIAVLACEGLLAGRTA